MPKKKIPESQQYGNIANVEQVQSHSGILKIKFKDKSLVFLNQIFFGGECLLAYKNVCLTLVLTFQMTKREVRGKQ